MAGILVSKLESRSLRQVKAALLGAGVLALAACGRSAPDCGALAVEAAWVRAAPPGASMTAGYFIARNPGTAAVRVTGVASPDFQSAAMHRTKHSDGQMQMTPIEAFSVDPGGSYRFAPGGAHLMLHAPKQALQAGDTVNFELLCADGAGRLAFTATVRQRPPGPRRGPG